MHQLVCVYNYVYVADVNQVYILSEIHISPVKTQKESQIYFTCSHLTTLSQHPNKI